MTRPLDPTRAALLRGLVVGDTERLDVALLDAFRRAGLSHLLAVSGHTVAYTDGFRVAPPSLSFSPLGRRKEDQWQPPSGPLRFTSRVRKLTSPDGAPAGHSTRRQTQVRHT
ncbi:MAG TPA: ComEC/Rec2 family competence protein [Acidimicrobiia bacterium]|nr:ComEC/Rec2 family competence protein [Acidimicrobiia bacterium]